MVQINVGSSANDNTGDTLRAAFQKVNANTTELGTSITTSSDSIFNQIKVGKGAGNINTNTVVGKDSGINNTTGSDNSFFGIQSGYSNLNGSKNSFYGYSTGSSNQSGNEGTFFGYRAGASNIANQNTFLGGRAGSDNTYGTENVFLGSYAGFNNTTGSNNTYLGAYAAYTVAAMDNCSIIGYLATQTGSNQVQLGNPATTTYVYGTVQNRSDLRDKTEVRDTVLGLDFINELRPVDYKWDMREDYKTEMPIQGELSNEDFKIVMDAWLESVKLDNITHDGTHTRTRYHHGLIAQEVQDVIEASGVDFGGFQDHSVSGGQDVLSIGYNELIAPMIKAIQELTARINVLENN